MKFLNMGRLTGQRVQWLARVCFIAPIIHFLQIPLHECFKPMAALDTYLLCFIFIALRSTVPRSLKLKPQTMLIFWMESHLCLWPYFPPINHLVRILLLLYYLCHKQCRDKGIEMSFSLFGTLVILFRLIGQWLKLQSLISNILSWIMFMRMAQTLHLTLSKTKDSSGWLSAYNWPVQTCWLFSSQSGLLLWRGDSTWLRYSNVPRTGHGPWQHPVFHFAFSVNQRLLPCRFLSASFFWITFS